jgi:hypothetical protein
MREDLLVKTLAEDHIDWNRDDHDIRGEELRRRAVRFAKR